MKQLVFVQVREWTGIKTRQKYPARFYHLNVSFIHKFANLDSQKSFVTIIE